MRSRHKNTKTSYDFLAFFNVVASRQISPQVLFSAAKICKKFHIIIKKSYLCALKTL